MKSTEIGQATLSVEHAGYPSDELAPASVSAEKMLPAENEGASSKSCKKYIRINSGKLVFQLSELGNVVEHQNSHAMSVMPLGVREAGNDWRKREACECDWR